MYRFALYCILCVALLCTGTLHAIKFRPMNGYLAPSGKKATTSFSVINQSNKDHAAVQITIADRIIDEYGKETAVENTTDFMVYPSQIILKPGETQTVRVSWTGRPDIEQEQAYRIIAEQLPIDLQERESDGKGAIKIMMRFVAGLYVTPKNARPEIELLSVEGDDEKRLHLVFSNKGSRHEYLRNLSLKLTSYNDDGSLDSDNSVSLSAEELPKVAGENMLSGLTRQFTIPWPEKLPQGEISATFDYDTDFD